MFHKPPNNVLVQLRPNLELLNHKKRRTLKRSIYTDMYIYIIIHIYYIAWNHHHGYQNKDVLVPCTSLRCLPSRSCRQPHITHRIARGTFVRHPAFKHIQYKDIPTFPIPVPSSNSRGCTLHTTQAILFNYLVLFPHLRPFGFQTFRM